MKEVPTTAQKNRGTCRASILFLLLSLFNTASSWAQPSITSVTGNVSEGNQITITGNNFEVGPDVVLFDNFESGIVGDAIDGGSPATVGQWSGHGITKPRYYDSGCHSGSKCFRADMAAHWLAYSSLDLPGNGASDVFMSYWVKLPAGDVFPGASSSLNWKIIWLFSPGIGGEDHTNNNAITFPVGLGTTTPYFDLACNGCPFGNSNINLHGVNWHHGEWKYFAFWVHAANDSSGRIKFWHLNSSDPQASNRGVKLANPNDVNRPTVNKAGDLFKYLHVNGYGREEPNSHPMFDDVYVSTGPNAQARIEIGNNSVYANSTKIAVMTPASWNSNSVTAVVRQGIFRAGDSAYVFIINSSGVAGTGYPVTIGSGAPSDTLKPAAPLNLRSLQ